MLPLYLVIITIIANFFIASVVFHNNRRSATTLLLAFLCVINAGWTLFTYLALFSGPEEVRLFWVRTVMFVTSPFGPVIYFLTKAFPNTNLKVGRRIFWFAIILTVASAILATTPTMFTSLKNLDDGNFLLYPGPSIAVYGLNLMGFMSLGFYELIKKFRASKGVEKMQVSYFLLGIVLTFTLATITNFIAVVVFGTIKLAFIGPPLTLILVGFIAYAIVKHRLLNIRLLLARSIAFSALILLVTAFYTLAIFSISNSIFGKTSSLTQSIINIVLAFFIALSFQPLKELLQKITDSFLYKNEYNANVLLAELTNIMARVIGLDELTRTVLLEILGGMHITKGAIFIFGKDDSLYPPQVYGFGTNEAFEKETLFNLVNLKRIALLQEERVLENKAILERMNVSISLPLFVKDKPQGVVLLGGKKNGEIFTEGDIELLEIFASTFSIAIENSKSYEEIKHFNKTLQDEVNKATADLKKANEHLKELDRLKDEFVSVASHELRAPMTVVQGYLWKVLQDKKLTVEDRKSLDHAYSSTRRLIDLVNDMLDVSKIESGRMEFNPSKFDLVKLSEDVKEEFIPKLSEKSIDLEVEKAKECLVTADVSKIEQVLINIVDNAVKFTPEKGKIRISFGKKDGNIETSVSDTGVGIKPEDFSKLFTKFGRLDSALSGNYQTKGTGLGLYLCKKIIEKSGGKIWAEKGKKRGSTFTFALKAE